MTWLGWSLSGVEERWLAGTVGLGLAVSACGAAGLLAGVAVRLVGEAS